MKEVKIPIVDGKYHVVFPEKCVYCGGPKELMRQQMASAGRQRRQRYVTVDVPYCSEHAGVAKRNARVLTLGFVVILLTSCCVLFGVTTSINREPGTMLLVALGFVALGLAYGGRELFRRIMSRSIASMVDMGKGPHIGLKMELAGDEVVFSFTNDEIADEFARLNSVERDA
jgi:hypothetical protein